MTLHSRARLVRTVAIGLQLTAMVLVGTVLIGLVGSVVDGLGRPAARLDVATLSELFVLTGLLVIAFVGLRRWARGGSPVLLYGFDVLPLLFILFTAGPGALQDPLGLAIAAAFIVPLLVTWAASAGGGEAST